MTRPIQVVQVNCHLDPARREPRDLLDAWPTLSHVAAATAGEEVRVSVVQSAHANTVIERDGVTYYFVADSADGGSGRTPSALRRSRSLEQKVAELSPELIHIHGLTSPLQTRKLAAAVPSAKLLAQDHASQPPKGWRKAAHKWGFRRLSAVAFTAREQAQPFVEAGVFGKELPVFEVIEGSTLFEPGDRKSAQEKTGLRGDPCLLWVGRLDQNKDPLTVVSAFSRAVGRLRDPHLWCCYADNPLEDAVRQRILAEPELAERVHLVGALPHQEIERYYQASDFLLSASRSEGSGYSVIEALACGTTPLVTDIPPFRRITGNGAAGGLSSPGDSAGMAWSLLKWAKRDRGQLRRAARARFEKALSFAAIGAELRGVYREILRNP